MKKTWKRTIIRITSYTIAVILTLTGFIIQKNHEINYYRTQMSYEYSRSMEELSSGLNNINFMLEKGMYASTATQLSSLAAELWKTTGTSKSALSRLPSAGAELTGINRFLSQAGDFSLFLSKKLISGKNISDSERESLLSLSKTASTLAVSINNIRMEFEQTGKWNSEIIKNDQTLSVEGFGSTITEIEDTLTDYPTLIYDGPFSDHILTSQPKMLENSPEIDRESARAVAAAAIGKSTTEITDDADEDGKMPSYGFACGQTVISITKRGGYVVYIRNSRNIDAYTLSEEQAVTKAEKYLEQNGDGNFQSSYYFTDGGVCVINFAHKEGAVICYTDLIKVGVALDTGEVVFIEARGYLMNHYQRNIATPKYSAEQARSILSSTLNFVSSSLVLIPAGGGNESLCYEFLCNGLNGENVLVYINANNLEEENILILLKTDGGTLTK